MMNVEMTEKEYYIWLRSKKGISLQEVADEIGVSKVAVHYYETGKTNFRYDREKKYKQYIDNKEQINT